tara:strand:- start:6762 stop:7250 length:489 start_codon:yes stop_codon:yes gene_type:complete
LRFDDRLNGLVFIFLGGVVVFLAQQLPTLTFIDYGPGFFPTLIGCLMVIAGSVIALKPLLQRGSIIEWAALPNAQSWPRALGSIGVVVGAIAFFIMTLSTLGFLIAMPISLFAMLAFFDRRFVRDILIALIGSALLHSFFYQLMSVQLPWGLLTPYAGVLTW